MSLASFVRKITKFDKAVYWAPISKDRFNKWKLDAPVEVDVRWEDCQEEFIDDEGQTRISKSRIIINQAVAFGGVLWHGKLADLVDAHEPSKNGDGSARQIQKVETIPGMKNEFLFREVML